MAVEKISNRQLIFMIFLLRATVGFSLLPLVTTGTAGQDVWASGILFYIGSIFMTFIIVGLAVRFPTKSIIQYSKLLIGNVLGKFIGFIILAQFLHMAATDVRIYGELINSGFLPRTPLVIIIGSIVFLASVTAYLGIEVIGRMADFIFPWYIILVVGSIILPSIEILPDIYTPILAEGIRPVLSSSIVPIAISIQLITVSIILPHVNEPEKGVKSILISVSMASALIIALAMVVIGIVGPELASQAVFPFLFSVRSVTGMEILERIEILSILAWGLGTYVSLTVYLYCGSKGVSQFFGVESYRPLIFPMAVIWTTLSIHSYDSIYQLHEFFSPEIIFPFIIMFLIISFGLLWGAYLLRSKLTKKVGQKR